jgi:hypothetical protein
MSSFLIAFWIVAAAYGIAAAFRTFKNEMRDDRKVWFLGACGLAAAVLA